MNNPKMISELLNEFRDPYRQKNISVSTLKLRFFFMKPQLIFPIKKTE